MSGDTFFNITEIAQQLNVGVSTVKVWSIRYAKWLLTNTGNEDGVYSKETLEKFQLIAECTASGMDKPAIERVLSDITEDKPNVEAETTEADVNRKSEDIGDDTKEANSSIFGNINSAGFDNILLEILNQQKKIASAQERRAAAEERKAFASESRAETEMLKANTMQEILTVLKETSNQTTVNSLMNRIQQMPGPSPSELRLLSPETDFDFTDSLDDLPELTETIPESPPTSINVEDIADDTAISKTPEEIDDSETEIEKTESEPGKTATSEKDQESQHNDEVVNLDLQNDATSTQSTDVVDPLSDDTINDDDDLDDLSLLIDGSNTQPIDDLDDLPVLTDDAKDQPDDDIDDLSLLIDGGKEQPDDDIDDLPVLTDDAKDQPDDDIDDLSLLIDGGKEQPDDHIDDLSLLIDDGKEQPDDDIDDLSFLIDSGKDQPVDDSKAQPIDDMDDLSKLIGSPAEPDKEKPQEKTLTDAEHKSQVLSKILKMKEQEGLSIEETTKRLNDEGTKTLSGKGQWDSKTIAGIYKYIDSGKGKQ